MNRAEFTVHREAAAFFGGRCFAEMIGAGSAFDDHVAYAFGRLAGHHGRAVIAAVEHCDRCLAPAWTLPVAVRNDLEVEALCVNCLLSAADDGEITTWAIMRTIEAEQCPICRESLPEHVLRNGGYQCGVTHVAVWISNVAE